MQKPVLTDQQLVELYQQGNENCLTILIERHQKRIFSAILFLVNDRETAEDIFQDTFVKVINTLETRCLQRGRKISSHGYCALVTIW